MFNPKTEKTIKIIKSVLNNKIFKINCYFSQSLSVQCQDNIFITVFSSTSFLREERGCYSILIQDIK